MMSTMRLRPTALARASTLALASLALVPAQASAAKYLWATVNVCDTTSAPDTIGVRASMPGNGTSQRMYMRFEAQYYDTAEERFRPTGSSSRWIRVGSARFTATQSGFSFEFAPPPAGTQFIMRGRVDYQWRAKRRRNGRTRWVTVLRRKRYTRAGFSGVQGGDPPGYSQAFCVIR